METADIQDWIKGDNLKRKQTAMRIKAILGDMETAKNETLKAEETLDEGAIIESLFNKTTASLMTWITNGSTLNEIAGIIGDAGASAGNLVGATSDFIEGWSHPAHLLTLVLLIMTAAIILAVAALAWKAKSRHETEEVRTRQVIKDVQEECFQERQRIADEKRRRRSARKSHR